MEINNTTISVYYTSCALGFAPYSLARDKFNQFIHVKFNRLLCIYSIAFLTIFCALTNYGLYFDTNSKFPIRLVLCSFFCSAISLKIHFHSRWNLFVYLKKNRNFSSKKQLHKLMIHKNHNNRLVNVAQLDLFLNFLLK